MFWYKKAAFKKIQKLSTIWLDFYLDRVNLPNALFWLRTASSGFQLSVDYLPEIELKIKSNWVAVECNQGLEVQQV
jgi:hypothetical protein